MGAEVFCSNNGIKVLAYEKTFLLDYKSAEENALNLVSHGHQDHLPAKYNSENIICSRHTAKILRLRRNKDIKVRRSREVKFLDAGHTIGSRMFLINKEVLYTGDFNTTQKYCGKARPVKCDTLIIDATFGAKKYVFPKYQEVIKEFRDYLEENQKVVICAYSFGKAQEVAYLLDKFRIPFNITAPIQRVHQTLGLKYRCFSDDEHNVIIQHHYEPKQGYKKIAMSGWASEKFYNYALQLDKSFIISSHADYNQLMDFVRKCSPERVYPFGTHAVELSASIRKNLSINAQPLLKNQKTLGNYL